MSRARILSPRQVWDSDEFDAGVTVTVRVDANARDRKDMLNDRERLLRFVDEHLYPERCDCRHCQNDWDCCGRMIGYRPKIHVVKGGLLITQSASRNV